MILSVEHARTGVGRAKEQRVILEGTPPVEVTLKRSARARRLSLRVSRLDGRVTLTLPKRLPVSEAEAFAREKESWLRRQLDSQPEVVLVGVGMSITVEGETLRIVTGEGRNTRVEGDRLIVPGPPDAAAARVRAFLKLLARDRLVAASDHYASVLGVRYGRVTLRDTRSRWGSCTSAGNLMYSWRLILAPPEVLDYVAAHEVSHLVEMNHSPAYWKVVARLLPDYQAPRRWLKVNGAQLHRYRFGD